LDVSYWNDPPFQNVPQEIVMRHRPTIALGSCLLLLSLLASACSDSTVPSELTLGPETVRLVAIGATQQLTATVRDEDGDVLGDEPIAFASSDESVVTVDANGLVTAVGVGGATVSATSGSLSADVAATVAIPVAMEVAGGNLQEAPAGTAVGVPPAVRVVDAADAPVAGVTVQFAVTEGGGTVIGATKTTGANGLAAPDGWTLGAAGVNLLSATATNASIANSPISVVAVTASPVYNIVMRAEGEVPAQAAIALARAQVRWETVVTGDLPDHPVTLPENPCGVEGFPAVDETVDDLLILYRFVPIAGDVVAQAGWCVGRTGGLPAFGLMEADPAKTDDPALVSNYTHQLGHVLGFGVFLWTAQSLLADPACTLGTTSTCEPGHDPHFSGAQALAAFAAVPGAGGIATEPVPVEDTGGPGSADNHWRESVFGNELMSPVFDPVSNPLSAVTIASLRDVGYTVDMAAADPFTSLATSRRSPVVIGKDVLRMRIRYVR
jgi:hypothetical protein